MTAEFLDGPRARRLCLELACVADAGVRDLLSDLAYKADVAAGASITRFGWDAEGNTFTASGPVPVGHTTVDLALRIAGHDGAALTAADIEEAFRVSVDAARYWQEPDGADIVASDPLVRAALEQVARGVLERDEVTWWTRERTTVQWAIEWDPTGAGAPFDPAPGAAAAWAARSREDDERAARERPRDPHARWSGDWWSHPWGAPHTTGGAPSGLPLGIPYLEDSFGSTLALAIPVRGGGRTFEVRGADDWAELCRRYPLELTASRRHDWQRVTDRDGRWLLPDWALVSQEWDAVHLTAWGYLTAATREIVVDDECSSVIGGWGPDETYWLTGLVREVEGPRVLWVADEGEGLWKRA